MANTGLLAGIKCPKCGWTESFEVEMSKMVLITDEQMIDDWPRDPLDWTDDSYCRCGRAGCDFDGVFGDFRVS